MGLDPIRAVTQQLIEVVRVDHIEGRMLEFISSQTPNRRMLVVMVPHDQFTWFFKMLGDEALVTQQKPKFNAFVRSVRFSGASRD